MNICLINPLHGFKYKEDPFNSYYGSGRDHLVCEYIRMLLKNTFDMGVSVEIIDNNFDAVFFKPEMVTYFEKFDVVGVMFNEVNIRYAYITSLRVRSFKQNHKIIAFGPTATLDYKKILERKIADICILGEAEASFVDIIRFYHQGENDIGKIKGISYLRDNRIIRNEIREFMDLDEFPVPERPVVAGVIPVMTSRGCYGNCSFCVNSSGAQFNSGKKLRLRNPQKVIDEIEYLYNKNAFQTVVITDNVFSMERKWTEEFLSGLENLNLNIKFQCAIRANDVIAKEDLIKRFKDLGLEWIEIGIESLVDRQLELYQKNITAEQNLKALEIAQKHRLGVYIDFLIFEPLISINEIKEMIDKIKNHVFFKNPTYVLNPLSMSNVFYSYPHTKLTDFYVKNQLIDKSGELFTYAKEDMREYIITQRKYTRIIKELFKCRYLYQLSKNNEQKQKVIDAFKDLFFLDLDIMEQIIYHLYDKNIYESIMARTKDQIEIVKNRISKIQNEIEFECGER